MTTNENDKTFRLHDLEDLVAKARNLTNGLQLEQNPAIEFEQPEVNGEPARLCLNIIDMRYSVLRNRITFIIE